MLLLVCLALSKVSLIPEPKSYKAESGTWTMQSGATIHYDTLFQQSIDAANLFAKTLRVSTGFKLPVLNTTEGETRILLKYNEKLADEEYELTVSTKDVTIWSSSYNGFVFGFTTFMQLLPAQIYSKHRVLGVSWDIAACTINDSPRFKWRGIMLDVSRHFFDVDGVKKVIEGLAMLKMNVLHMHLTDDNGWRIEIKGYPGFTQRGSTSPGGRPVPWHNEDLNFVPYGPFYYTHDEIRELVAYAKVRGITIVPEIEMPGHSLSGVSGYPEISCNGIGPFEPCSLLVGNKDVYCPGNDRTFEILKGVLDEVMELFDSVYVHVGGDECDKERWRGCAKCQKRIKDEGLSNVDELQSWMIQQMANYIESKGHHLIGWDEILEGGLAQGAAVMSWRGTSGGAAAAALGHNVVMSPGAFCYLDHNQFFQQGTDIYQYNCCLNPLYSGYSYDPMDGIQEKDQKYIMGVQGNMWTEYVWGGDLDVQYHIFPRAAALAEVGWTTSEKKSWVRFISASVRGMRHRFEINDIFAAPLALGRRALWTPKDLTTGYVTKTWDITGAVGETGPHECAFVLTDGTALKLKNVKLLFGSSVVASDDHEGTADWSETGTNTYKLSTSRGAGAEQVFIQADISCVDGTDSYGEAVIYRTDHQ